MTEKKKYDNQEYYDRKMKHREEMLPYLAVCFGVCLLIVMVAAIVNILGSW
jgi:CTP synthase (UTP-ammonia lyase)